MNFDSTEQIDRLIAAFCDALQPPPALTVSEWADRHRVLSGEASALKGPWTTLPYQKEPLDVLSPSHPCEIAVYRCASQIMKTELLLNFLGFLMHLDPGPALFVEPREKDAKAVSTDRVDPMIRDMPVLQERVGTGHDDTLFHKSFRGGHVTFAGAISPSGLAMRPIRYLFLDEVDRYKASVSKEGNPITLAIRRTDTFKLNRKIAIASTPTFPGSNIDLWYQASDQRKYHVPCPFCEFYQILLRERMYWEPDSPENTQFRCAQCQRLIEHYYKAEMVEAGRWIADNPKSTIAGFWLPKQYALIGPNWGDLTVESIEAAKNPESLRAFVNTVWAEPYEDKYAAKIDQHALANRAHAYGPEVPDEVAVLTAGVDVQGNRLEIEILGHGDEEESWSIRHFVLTGNPERPEIWKELDEILQARYENESGIELPIRAACVDSSDNTKAVYAYTRTRFSRRIYAIKGKEGFRPIWPKKVSKGRDNSPLFIVGVDVIKDSLLERFKIENPGPGYCHFPLDRSIDYYEQLTVERKYPRYRNGFRDFIWKKPEGAANEAWDIRVYAVAALHALYSNGFNLKREAERMSRQIESKRNITAEAAALAAATRLAITPAAGTRAVMRPKYSSDPYL